MHKNFRRKSGRHNPRRGVGWSNRRPAGGFAWEKKMVAKKVRQGLRSLLHHGKWDLVPQHYPRTILWDYW
jgi:hypothetical protein